MGSACGAIQETLYGDEIRNAGGVRKKFAKRDLLTSGQVTLGDIQVWMGQANDALCATVIGPLLRIPLPQPWFLTEGRIVAAEEEVAGKQARTLHQGIPQTQRFRTVSQEGIADQHRLRLSELQGRLRQLLREYPEGLPLAACVNQESWR